MARDSLVGLELEGKEARDIIKYAKWTDIFFGHGKHCCHRVGKYQKLFEDRGGDSCRFPGSEWTASILIAKARRIYYLPGKEACGRKMLGRILHLIQDITTQHVLSLKEGIISPHALFELYLAFRYSRSDWPLRVKNAAVEPVDGPEDLEEKMIRLADCVAGLPCSYVRQDGERIVDPRVGDISWYGWRMSDEDIGRVLEKISGLTKGAVLYALRKGENSA